MSSEPGSEITEDDFLEAVSAIRFVAPDLSPIGAAMLAAIHFGIANDSRAFSLKLGVEHALTLREVTALSSPELGFLNVISRSERTQRTHLSLTDKGKQLIARAFASN